MYIGINEIKTHENSVKKNLIEVIRMHNKLNLNSEILKNTNEDFKILNQKIQIENISNKDETSKLNIDINNLRTNIEIKDKWNNKYLGMDNLSKINIIEEVKNDKELSPYNIIGDKLIIDTSKLIFEGENLTWSKEKLQNNLTTSKSKIMDDLNLKLSLQEDTMKLSFLERNSQGSLFDKVLTQVQQKNRSKKYKKLKSEELIQNKKNIIQDTNKIILITERPLLKIESSANRIDKSNNFSILNESNQDTQNSKLYLKNRLNKLSSGNLLLEMVNEEINNTNENNITTIRNKSNNNNHILNVLQIEDINNSNDIMNVLETEETIKKKSEIIKIKEDNNFESNKLDPKVYNNLINFEKENIHKKNKISLSNISNIINNVSDQKTPSSLIYIDDDPKNRLNKTDKIINKLDINVDSHIDIINNNNSVLNNKSEDVKLKLIENNLLVDKESPNTIDDVKENDEDAEKEINKKNYLSESSKNIKYCFKKKLNKNDKFFFNYYKEIKKNKFIENYDSECDLKDKKRRKKNLSSNQEELMKINGGQILLKNLDSLKSNGIEDMYTTPIKRDLENENIRLKNMNSESLNNKILKMRIHEKIMKNPIEQSEKE